MRTMAILLVCLLAAGQVDGQGFVQWTQPAPGPAPIFRTEVSLAYDSARSRVFMFGGQGGQGAPLNLSDTWVYGGSGWNQLLPNTVPPARYDHAIAYDSARDRIVLFGGVIGQGFGYLMLNDTWEFDGQDWIQRSPQTSPPARYAHDMTYDPARGRVVLYGGNTGPPGGWTDLADTWEWDGTNWTRVLTPAPSPPPARWHAMAFDASRGVVVLVHGPINGSGLQTWEYDGTQWSRRFPSNEPPDRWEHGLAYDAARQRIVLFGGNPDRRGIYSGVLNDAWEYDGTDWTRRFPVIAPTGREGHGMTYDLASERVVVFGGRDSTSFRQQDTWEYGPTFPARFSRFGNGCPGSAGLPSLGTPPGQRPWLGDTVQLELGNLVPGSVAFLALGLSNTQWGTRSLPFALAGLGMPGCTAYVSTDNSLLLLASPSGTAQQAISVPTNLGLLGQTFYTQALALDPGINALGATVTNAGEMVVGRR